MWFDSYGAKGERNGILPAGDGCDFFSSDINIFVIFVCYNMYEILNTRYMKKSYLFLADGFEEVEALATVDVLRRAEMDVTTVSINATREVTGAHGVSVNADCVISDMKLTADTEWLICPGGMPGASNLAACEPLTAMLREHYARGGRVAAICASPAVVLAPLGILDERPATCYPGFESIAAGVDMTGKDVVALDTLVTANGPANTLPFAFAIVSVSKGTQVASDVAAGMLYGK